MPLSTAYDVRFGAKRHGQVSCLWMICSLGHAFFPIALA
jgi:hypothetical protein